MRPPTEYLTYETKAKRDLVRLTSTLEAILARTALEEGRGGSVIVKIMGE